MTQAVSVPMKSSGLGWAGDIPAHWDVAKICLIARLESGHTPSRQHPEYWVPEECTTPWFSLADVWQLREAKQDYLGETAEKISVKGMANSAARILPAGTVALSRTASVGFAGIMPQPMATTQDFANFVCGERVMPEFLLYALRAMSDEFARSMMGSTHQTIYMPDLRRLAIPVPPRAEQERIVGVVRGRLPALDTLIAKKARLIELLREERQAVITHAVTQGLDPSVPRKETGVPSLGLIPAHWKLKRLMHLTPPCRPIMYGIVLPGPNVDDGIPIVKSGDCSPGKLRLERLHRTTPEIEAPYARARLMAGDIVYAIRGSIGMAARVPSELEGANLTQDAARIAPDAGTDSQWLLYAVQSTAVWAQLEPGIVGATVKGINIRDLKRPFVPVPPHGEQRAIARHLGAEISGFDRTVLMTAASLEKLREYRQAVITAAVTGKLDVSNGAF